MGGTEEMDDRRLHYRALAQWQEKLPKKGLPSLSDFHPSNSADLAENSFVLDVAGGIRKPVIVYSGAQIDEACGEPVTGRVSTELPGSTVFFHLADHFVEAIANRAPISFEAEYRKADGTDCRYRGILLPLSENGADINAIVGVLNWAEFK